ncbi:unnamed protein product, partial [Rotaria sp. Silwood2]
MKHKCLRTSLVFDIEKNTLIQRIVESNDNNNELFTFIESTIETDEELKNIMYDERKNPNHFNLAQGLVFRCHVVFYKQHSNNDLDYQRDTLIFNFHHAMFDFPSIDVFHQDLNQAYTTGQLSDEDEAALRYIDYAVIEQEAPMTAASAFWLESLRDCKIDHSLALPFDRYRISDEHRTGRGALAFFDFGEGLSQAFITRTSISKTTLEYMALASYYAFLFKLTNGEKDLCIGMNIDGRYKTELISVIGMFANAIPLRCQIDPNWSFIRLVEEVQQMAADSLHYSYFPLQRILAQHPLVSKPAFLDISFQFDSNSSENIYNQIILGDICLSPVPYSIEIGTDEVVSKFDFSLNIYHNSATNQLSCTINASLDLFEKETINKFA